MTNSTKPVKLNATLFWVCNAEVNKESGKYQFDACRLTPKAIEALEALGITIKESDKESDKRGKYITVKSENQFRFFDEHNEKLPVETLISNGSKATLLVGTYAWNYKGKAGISPTLKGLSFTELIVYENGGAVDSEGAL